MRIIIVGGGNVGYYLAKTLVANKHVVSVIEKDKQLCGKIARELNVLAINGDGCDQQALKDSGIEKADVIAAITGHDEDNLVICQIAKETFDIKRTVARVNDSNNEHVFDELGVDVPIDSTAIVAKIIEEEVSFKDFVNLMTFKRGKLAIVRVDLTKDSPVCGNQVMDVKLPEDSVLISIIRGDDVIIPRGQTILQERDDVIALTTIENEQQLLDMFIGNLD